MTIVEINTCNYGSTGRIMLNIAKAARHAGNIVYTFSRAWNDYSSRDEKDFCFGTYIENGLHHILSTFTGIDGCGSIIGTRRLIKKLKTIHPDIIHLHNIHGFYINYHIFFRYVKENNIKLVWTFHDCWPITGRCPYFEITGCRKWQNGCGKCPYSSRLYPMAKVDQTYHMWQKKKELFTNISNLTIVTPSKWLAEVIDKSFLASYTVCVINNGIDLSVFYPRLGDFRARYVDRGSQKRFMVLGVALGWEYRKGLDTFVELSKLLSDDYQIVLVGTSNDIELPQNIITIHKTQNQSELAEIYSAADVFVNPTREDNFPTTHLESLACGTPVITTNVGGSCEMIDETCGCVVEKDNINQLYAAIVKTCSEQPYRRGDCVKKAQKYDMNVRFNDYLKLYNSICAQ